MTSMYKNFSLLDMANEISTAEAHVKLIIPSITIEVALALVDVSTRIGLDSVEIILDADVEMMREGYGQVEAILMLYEAGISIRNQQGLRLCILVVDWHSAWVVNYREVFNQQEQRPLVTAIALMTVQASVIASMEVDHIGSSVNNYSIAYAGNSIIERESYEIGEGWVGDDDVLNLQTEVFVPNIVQRPIPKGVYPCDHLQLVSIGLKFLNGCDYRVTLPDSLIKYSLSRVHAEDCGVSVSYRLFEDFEIPDVEKIRLGIEAIKQDLLFLGEGFGYAVKKSEKRALVHRLELLRQEFFTIRNRYSEIFDQKIESAVESIAFSLLDSALIDLPNDLVVHNDDKVELILFNFLVKKIKASIPSTCFFLWEHGIDYRFSDIPKEMQLHRDFQEMISLIEA